MGKREIAGRLRAGYAPPAPRTRSGILHKETRLRLVRFALRFL